MERYGFLEGKIYFSGDTEENLRIWLGYLVENLNKEFETSFYAEKFGFYDNNLIVEFQDYGRKIYSALEEIIVASSIYYRENSSLIKENIRFKLEYKMVVEDDRIYETSVEYKWDYVEEGFVKKSKNEVSHAFNVSNMKKTKTYDLYSMGMFCTDYIVDLASFVEDAERYVGRELGNKLNLIKPFREAHLENQTIYVNIVDLFNNEFEESWSQMEYFSAMYYNLIHVKAKCGNPIILNKYLEYTREYYLYDNVENGIYEFIVIGDKFNNLKKLAKLEILEETVYPPVQMHENVAWAGGKTPALAPKWEEGVEEIISMYVPEVNYEFTEEEISLEDLFLEGNFEVKQFNIYGDTPSYKEELKLENIGYAEAYKLESFEDEELEVKDVETLDNGHMNYDENSALENLLNALKGDEEVEKAPAEFAMPEAERADNFSIFNMEAERIVSSRLVKSVRYLEKNLNDKKYSLDSLGSYYIEYLFEKNALLTSLEERLLKLVLRKIEETESSSKENYKLMKMLINSDYLKKVLATYASTDLFYNDYLELEELGLGEYIKYEYGDIPYRVPISLHYAEMFFKNLDENEYNELKKNNGQDYEYEEKIISLLEKFEKEELDAITGFRNSQLLNFLTPNFATIKIKLLDENKFVDLNWIDYQELLHDPLFGPWMKCLVVAINKKEYEEQYIQFV